jgi:ABC-type uncharacterized transport system substrate-binding protein
VPLRVALTVVLAFALLATPVTAAAQPAGKVFRVGVLGIGALDLLRESLRDVGYVEGRNVVIEWRDPEGRPERFDALAAELVRLKVDVIIASNPGATFAAKKATASTPIVMVHTPDPVQLGLVGSLGRPGGNITGTTSLSADLSVKQLEVLKEAFPRATRVAEAAARALAVQLQSVEVRGPEQLDDAFAVMIKERAEAVLVFADPMTFFHRARIADLAVKRRLPTMCGVRGYVEAGGLMSYWAYEADLYRRVASYVDRILKGAKPGELPIEQPTRFELVVNLKTAKALGLTIPPSLLLRADEVIQ